MDFQQGSQVGVDVGVECPRVAISAHQMVHPHGLPRCRATGKFCFLGCRAAGDPVPLLAEALVRTGRASLTVDARAKFVKAYEGVCTVPECLLKILTGYPESVRMEYMRRWEQAEVHRRDQAKKRARRKKASLSDAETMDDSDSNQEEVPEMMANLSTVALDGMDQDNSKELEKDKKRMLQFEHQRAKRYMRSKLRQAMATAPVTKKHKSNVKWASR